MLQNAYLLADIGTNTAENERIFFEILPKIGNYTTDPLPLPGSEEELLVVEPVQRNILNLER